MNRFFVNPAILPENASEVLLDGEVAHQLIRVLRLTPGKQILLLDNQGFEYAAELTEIRRQGKQEVVAAKVLSRQPAAGEPKVHITLYQGLLKGEKFEYVLQKGTEIGISQFVPLVSARAVGQAVRAERWQKIIQEAAEQSRRGRVPELATNALSFSAALRQVKASGATGLLAWEEEHSQTLRSLPPDLTKLALFIGPEGGFTPEEAAQAQAAGLQIVTLGQRILRAETAGVVAAALALYQLEAL